jgi:aryl-alcohol dehydrogenase-like predicted oxidoreductase
VLAGTRTREGARQTTRAGSDQFTDYLYSQPTDFDVVERVAEVADERSVSPAQVALAWLLGKPGVTAPSWERPSPAICTTHSPPSS